MVRQLHLRTQGDQESSSAHPDVIGDRCVFVTEEGGGDMFVVENIFPNSIQTVRKITLLTFPFFI